MGHDAIEGQPLHRRVHIAFHHRHVFQAGQAAIEFGKQRAPRRDVGGPDVAGVARAAHGGDPRAGADIQHGFAWRLRQTVHEFARVLEDRRVDDVRRQGALGAIRRIAAVADREVLRRSAKSPRWRIPGPACPDRVASRSSDPSVRSPSPGQHPRQFVLPHVHAVAEQPDQPIHGLLQRLADQFAGRRAAVFRQIIHLHSAGKCRRSCSCTPPESSRSAANSCVAAQTGQFLVPRIGSRLRRIHLRENTTASAAASWLIALSSVTVIPNEATATGDLDQRHFPQSAAPPTAGPLPRKPARSSTWTACHSGPGASVPCRSAAKRWPRDRSVFPALPAFFPTACSSIFRTPIPPRRPNCWPTASSRIRPPSTSTSRFRNTASAA